MRHRLFADGLQLQGEDVVPALAEASKMTLLRTVMDPRITNLRHKLVKILTNANFINSQCRLLACVFLTVWAALLCRLGFADILHMIRASNCNLDDVFHSVVKHSPYKIILRKRFTEFCLFG